MTLRLSILLLALAACAGCGYLHPGSSAGPFGSAVTGTNDVVDTAPMTMMSAAAIYNPPLASPTVEATVFSGHMTMLVSVADTNHFSAIGVQSAPTPNGPWLDESMWPVTEQPVTYTVATSRQCYFYRSFAQ